MAFAFNCSIVHTVHASESLTKEQSYKILGLLPQATSEEISKTYRKLSLKYHPDKNLGNEDVIAKFHQLKPAYEVLNKNNSCTDTGLTLDETFELYQIIQKINSLISNSKHYLSKDIIEQQMDHTITAKDYKQELEKQKELLQRIKQEISDKNAFLGQEGDDIYEHVIHKVDDARAKVMYIFKELKNKYKNWGFSISPLSNSMTIGLEDAKKIYKSRMKLADVLHDIKGHIQKHPGYFHPDAISIISRIESFDQAEDELYKVKTIIDDKNEEVRKINIVFDDIKRVRQEAGLTGNLPQAHQMSLDQAQELYKDTQFFAQYLQGIRNAMNQNSFSAQFRSTLPESLKSSEEAKQTLNKINAEIERLRIEKETERINFIKTRRRNDFNDNYDRLQNSIEINKSYISLAYQNNLSQYFTSTKNIPLSDLSDEQVKESKKMLESLDLHIQLNKTAEINDILQNSELQWARIGVTRISSEARYVSLDAAKQQANKDKDAIEKIRLLNQSAMRYRSIATLGLQSAAKKRNEIIVRNDNDINVLVRQTQHKEIGDKWAAGATVTTAIGAATAMAGFAVHNYFKNK